MPFVQSRTWLHKPLHHHAGGNQIKLLFGQGGILAIPKPIAHLVCCCQGCPTTLHHRPGQITAQQSALWPALAQLLTE